VITRLELGGAQQNTLYCTAHHDRARFAPALIAGAGGILDDEARRIEGAHVDLVPWLRHPVSPVADLRAILRLRRMFHERRYDLVHTHSSKAGILGRIAARLARVPAVVHTVHGWSFNDTQPGPLRASYVGLERLAARWTNRIVVVAAGDRDKGLTHGIGAEERYAVVRSGIDPTLYERPSASREAIRRQLGFVQDQVVVGTVACLKPQKAPLDFVRAAALAHARDGRLRFVVAGDGELRGAMERLIGEEKLDGVVHLLGWREDVPDLLHALDVFLLTSRFEGLPRSVLQAMAAGVPVVATAVDGTPEIVRDGETGLLIPPGRPDLAAERVIKMIRRPELRARCVEGGRRALTAEFDIRRMVRDLERLYLDLLEPARETRESHQEIVRSA
jgi:glycosyltransferase involved in cell wall biosynthesis